MKFEASTTFASGEKCTSIVEVTGGKITLTEIMVGENGSVLSNIDQADEEAVKALNDLANIPPSILISDSEIDNAKVALDFIRSKGLA